MYKPRIFWLLGLFLLLAVVPGLWADQFDKEVVNGMVRMARDIHLANKAVNESGSENAIVALSREAASADSFKKVVASIDSEEKIDKAIEQIRLFGYRVTSQAEKKSFEQAIHILEGRLKFMAQTENRGYLPRLQTVQALQKEFSGKFNNLDSNVGERMQLLASNARTAPVRSSGSLLGAHVANGHTLFSVYSPDATEVKLHLFKKATDKKGAEHLMQKGNDGIWRLKLKGELYGTYYGYTVDGPKAPGFLFDPERLLSDPYAFSNVDHDGKSLVIDRSFKWTDQGFKRPAAKDSIIYEMHIKDFTAHSSSGVTGPHKGKYLGMLEGKGSDVVLGHLKDLGVNVIELMPVHEFDNNFAGVTNHWGYMTSHFFAPETSFATGKSGEAVTELKALINGLHREGFAVMLDVVYNHTAEGNHQGSPLNFKGFDNPGYYRLMDNKKYYWNGTGCGNEMRTENPMTAKMIIDSLKYWMDDYHVDGFRFDLGTIIDKKTMQRILDELPKDTIITAEPWAADWQRNQWGKSDFRNTSLAKWNDDFREKMRSFINGKGSRNDVMTVMAGTCFWWTSKPSESLNYLEAHDGYTLFDLFKGDKKKSRLAAVILLTAQGIPMIHAGQEFDRSKKGNHNSYDQDNAINYINWNVKRKNKDLFDLYKGLIAMRKKYPNFRHAVALNNQHIDWIQPANGNGVGMFLKGKDNFVVLLNSDPHNWINFKLPLGGDWKVVCDGEKFNDSGLYTAAGDYNVPPTTGVILRK